MPRGRKGGEYSAFTEAEFKAITKARDDGVIWTDMPMLIGRPDYHPDHLRRSYAYRVKANAKRAAEKGKK